MPIARKTRIVMAAIGLVILCACPEAAPGQSPRQFAMRRQLMVEKYIAAEGIDNPRVLKSMRETPRHKFVPRKQVRNAYYDAALPIGHSQTISPPFIVAYMTQTIDPRPSDVVLEIGTGSGYQAAVLSPLVKDVYTIEIVEELGQRAAETLEQLDYDNVHVKIGDGYQGWPEHAPFDKIIVTCSPEKVPAPLIAQLAEGGKLLIPLGKRYQQVFYLFEKKNGKLQASELISTLFVPMTGISEDRRNVLPDPLHPDIDNGGFEEDGNNDALPDGWHYLRQAELVAGASPDGTAALRIENEIPGRLAQGLQGFGIDGREIAGLRISASMLIENFRPARSRDPAGIVVLFFDEKRRRLAAGMLKVPNDSGEWSNCQQLLRVPTAAREAILAITLAGGEGVLYVDDVRIGPVPR